MGVGEGAKLSPDERQAFVAAMFFGFAFSSAVGLLVQYAIQKLASLEDDYMLLAGVTVLVPVVCPVQWGFPQIAAASLGMSLGVACLSASRISRPVLLSFSIWHCMEAHAEFERWLRAARTESVGPGGIASSDKLMTAMAPFFRFGASVGLAIAAALTPFVVVGAFLITLSVAAVLAVRVYRRGSRRQEQQCSVTPAAAGENSFTTRAGSRPSGSSGVALPSTSGSAVGHEADCDCDGDELQNSRNTVARLWEAWLRDVPSTRKQSLQSQLHEHVD